jgi:hypothetical protein
METAHDCSGFSRRSDVADAARSRKDGLRLKQRTAGSPGAESPAHPEVRQGLSGRETDAGLDGTDWVEVRETITPGKGDRGGSTAKRGVEHGAVEQGDEADKVRAAKRTAALAAYPQCSTDYPRRRRTDPATESLNRKAAGLRRRDTKSFLRRAR